MLFDTSFSNLVLSSIYFITAGMIWNLENTDNKITFSFMKEDWFEKTHIKISAKLFLLIIFIGSIFVLSIIKFCY